ncbi:MAG: hypothetical protein OQK32_06000 [Gammaproteobacteria bacterium]|nr:hypothetical protein [Gammaproteobacteria bacterium]MCW8922758.1 hypothetical protein [Gammaproteobacteria bacterium]
MNFKTCNKLCLYALFIFLAACSSGDETNLVNLHTVADQDIVSISFPADTETILSINSEYDFSLQGLTSNGVETTISGGIQWSLSDGAVSTIDQKGHFTASATAELITVTAEFGFFSDSIEIKVSSAKFDQVVQFDQNELIIDMCRSQTFTPIGSYIDENGNEEIRPVDSITINTIDWIIRDQDNNPSQRAHIETLDNQATLHSLAEGNIIIQAKAVSQYSNTEMTSGDFDQAITNNLNSIKLCYSSASDLTSCAVTNASVKKDKSISLISVANYQALDGSDFYENISANSKWGIDNTANASIALSTDAQQLNITGATEASNATISVACGDIEQAIDGIDISQGVVLDTPVSCLSGASCLSASSTVAIDLLSVTSLKVSANNTNLTSAEALILSVRPVEIDLITTAVFSDNTEADITSDTTLVYSITQGKDVVIEEKAGFVGIYTVLGAGTAEIKLDFRDETFYALIEIP